MSLLFFIHSMQAGGAERVTANLANHWVDAGWLVTIVSIDSSENDFYQLRPEIKRIGLELAGASDGLVSALGNNVRRVFRLRRQIRLVQPDVAVAMMSTANILLYFFSCLSILA